MVQVFTLKSGSKNQRIPVFASVSVITTLVRTHQGLTGQAYGDIDSAGYWRDNATSAVAITMATATKGTFTSGGFIEIDSTNMPGWYEFGVPDLCLANGSKYCAISLGTTEAVEDSIQILIHLIRSLAH